jgi:competence protein ComGC
MYIIKKDRGINLVKYMAILLIITIILFQVFIPKPDAEEVIINTIDYMLKNIIDTVELNRIITLKTISSTYISEKTKTHTNFIEKECVSDCKIYTVLVSKPAFYDFIIHKNKDGFKITYSLSQ